MAEPLKTEKWAEALASYQEAAAEWDAAIQRMGQMLADLALQMVTFETRLRDLEQSQNREKAPIKSLQSLMAHKPDEAPG